MSRVTFGRTAAWWAAAAVALTGLTGCPSKEPRVVLYCAQDREFAEPLFGEFQRRTGLPVAPKYDTESKKSVTFYTELLAERDRPRCDVYWNNEILATLRLARDGILEPYDSPAAAPYPASARAADHTWHAFAQRARVLLVNTRLVKGAERPRGLLDLTDARWRGRVVMAVPLYGTSATQAACLFDVLGPEGARRYYQGLKANGVQLAPGNKQVAEWVGQGRTPSGGAAAVGVTDTDDAVAEVRAGHEVAILFPDRAADAGGRMGTLFIPNTLAIPRGCPNPGGARRLVDYLLSAEVEAKLAESEGAQIPMNPEVRVKLPAGFETPATVKAMRVDFAAAADHWDEAQKFLRDEFAGP
jgi:iron(III) transport system substrate-binding protein